MPIADDTKVRLAPVLDALRGDLERHRTKAMAIEALITRLAEYANDIEPTNSDPKPKRRRRRGRPPTDPADKLRARKRESMRAYRARQKAASPVTKPARKRRRKAKAVAKVTDPIAANDHAATNMNPVASPVPDPQADLRERITKAETIETVIELLAAARTLADTAVEKSDRTQYRIGLELRARCERRGGLMLIAMAERGPKIPTTKLGITPIVGRWREYGRLTEERFTERLAWISRRGLPTASELQRNDPRPIPPPKMNLTEWVTDETGCLSRRLEASGETPRLEGEA